jgi:gliding motility-associated-like protein
MMRDLKHILLSLSILVAFIASGFVVATSPSKQQLAPFGDIVPFDTLNITTGTCNAKGTVCLPIRLGDALKLKITDNGKVLPVDIMNGCDFDSTSAYTYSNLFGQGAAGPYILTSWEVNGVIYKDTFQDIPELVSLMNGWDPMGNWVINPATQLISGGNSANRYDTMQVWVTLLQSPSYIGYNLGIIPNGTELSFSRGFHTVILEDSINNLTDTFYVHVTCSETIKETLTVGQASTSCLPSTDLLTSAVSMSYCSGDPSNNAVTFSLDPIQKCVTYTAIQPGAALACVVLCDSTGFCDTTFLEVKVLQANAVNNIAITLQEGGTYQHCFDTSNTSGQITTITPCGFSTGGFASYSINNTTRCVEVKGLKNGGTDYGCVVVCNNLGNCDTTYFTTLVKRVGPVILYDTVYVNQSGIFCVDKSQVTPVQNFEVFVEPVATNMDYTLDNATLCASYTGLSVSQDTLGVRISNNNGISDTTYLILTVLPAAPSIFYDTLQVGSNDQYCMNTLQLGGTTFNVTNICPSASGSQVSMVLDTLSLCVNYTAKAIGTDSACMVICDNLGVCDTFVIIVTTRDTILNLLPPKANDDAALTEVATPVTVQILTNDVVPGSVVGAIVLIPNASGYGSTRGSVLLNSATNTVVYTPPSDTCVAFDYFQYVVCNAVGCDTALVTIMVICADQDDKLAFYQGFSPNQDDVNDRFVIKNADKFPGNELHVYNRWGNQVFYSKNYRNNWDGTWNNKDLPDGVYFYTFDNGKGEMHTDCVVIRR